jgi:arylsulfatase
VHVKKKSLLSFFAFATFALAAPAAVASTPGTDADGGIARAYFDGIDLKPATFERVDGKKTNVLFIVVDALRPDHMGIYGYDKAREPTSPYMDQLGREGHVFLHHYVNAPWTRPSTASMLTGLYPSGHKTQTDQSKLPPGIRTVGMDMKKLGYQTAAVVGNGNGSSVAGLDRGFDSYIDTTTHWERLPTAKQVFDDAVVTFDTKIDKKKPWMMFLFVVDPHDPYHAPEEYEKRYLDEGFTGEPRRRAHWEYKNKYPKRERDSMIDVYDAAIRYTDDRLKEFIGSLEERGLMENTTLILTADHGDGFGEHGYYLHAHHHYDEIIRVPLIVKSPAYKGNGHVFHLTQAIDLLPTMVGLGGGKPRKALPGRDIADMLKGPVDNDRLGLCEYNAFGIRRSSMFSHKWRAILQLPANEEEFLKHIPRKSLLPSVNFKREVLHLYDRAKDPRDMKNISRRLKKQPKEVRDMVDSLRTYMENAPEPNKDVDPKKVDKAILDDLRSLGYVQ